MTKQQGEDMPDEIWAGKPSCGNVDACVNFPGKAAGYTKYLRADLATADKPQLILKITCRF